ncbi:MAG: hypothetical protein M0P97_00830 [Candidatus Moranbacteria bacterium]|jgi:hypothetical protein|nr:hypothetical protein [Candidatus Moranbacteria bacterium]
MKKYYPILIFSGLTAAIVAPFFGSGFVFLIDMVWGPGMDFSDIARKGIDSGFPLQMVLLLLHHFFSAEVLQKIVLAGVLFLPGIAMYRLSLRYMSRSLATGAGLLYMLNLYVCERLMAGHWIVMLGYGFFPVSVFFLDRYFELRTWRRFVAFALVFSVYPIVSIHWAYIASGFLLVYGIVKSIKSEKSKVDSVENFESGGWRNVFLKMTILVAIFFAVNGFWLAGFFDSSQTFSNITLGDFEAFSTLPDPNFGIYFNVLALYGFWSSNFLEFKDFFSWWWMVALAVMFFSFIGALMEIRRRNVLARAVAVVFVPALLLSVGYGDSFTRPIIDFLFATLPFFRGLRDTEKISGIIAFSYAFLTPLGISYVVLYLGKIAHIQKENYLRFFSSASVAVIPFLWAGTLLFGAYGQIAPYDYPRGWYEAEAVLQADIKTNEVLFLPWHMYCELNFADRAMVANPANAFFLETMITGKNMDNRLLLEAEKSIWDEHVLLLSGEIIPDDREFWKSAGVSHFVVAKTDDWEKFSALYSSDYFEKEYDSESMTVFKIK